MTQQIIDAMYEGKDAGIPANIHDMPLIKEQLDEIGMIHCGYHRYYYRQEEMLAHGLEEYNTIGTRAEQVKRTEAELFELYKDPNLDHKPEQLAKRGGAHYSDAACETIAAIYPHCGDHQKQRRSPGSSPGVRSGGFLLHRSHRRPPHRLRQAPSR